MGSHMSYAHTFAHSLKDYCNIRKLSEICSENSPTKQRVGPKTMDEAKFKDEVQKAATTFKNLVTFKQLVEDNKVMMFSTTHCHWCIVAKKVLDDLGTKYKALEVNKMGSEGTTMMNVVSAVTGKRVVPTIFICGQLIPGGGSQLKHLNSSGELTKILEKCCKGDITCRENDQYRLQGH